QADRPRLVPDRRLGQDRPRAGHPAGRRRGHPPALHRSVRAPHPGRLASHLGLAPVTDQGTQAVALGWASRMEPGNLLYGTILATAALPVGASRGETAADMTETMATTLVVYWLAHIYVATVRECPRAARLRCTSWSGTPLRPGNRALRGPFGYERARAAGSGRPVGGFRRADEPLAPPHGGTTGPAGPAAGPAGEPQNRPGARCARPPPNATILLS